MHYHAAQMLGIQEKMEDTPRKNTLQQPLDRFGGKCTFAVLRLPTCRGGVDGIRFTRFFFGEPPGVATLLGVEGCEPERRVRSLIVVVILSLSFELLTCIFQLLRL